MDPATAMLASQAVGSAGSLAKTGYGLWQSIKGRKMLRKWEKDRPTMETPDAINEMVELFRDLSTRDRLPGQDIYEGNIRGSTATGIEAVKDMGSGAGGLGAVTQMVAGQQDRFSDLQAGLQQMITQNQGRLAGALGQQGQYQQMAWDWNKRSKWSEKMNEANAMLGAGTQNIFSGIEDTAKGIGDSMFYKSVLNNENSGGGGGMDIVALMKMLQGTEN